MAGRDDQVPGGHCRETLKPGSPLALGDALTAAGTWQVLSHSGQRPVLEVDGLRFALLLPQGSAFLPGSWVTVVP